MKFWKDLRFEFKALWITIISVVLATVLITTYFVAEDGKVFWIVVMAILLKIFIGVIIAMLLRVRKHKKDQKRYVYR